MLFFQFGSIMNEVIYIFIRVFSVYMGFPHSSVGKESVMQETPVQLLGREDPLEKGNTTHSSILAWKIPWTL